MLPSLAGEFRFFGLGHFAQLSAFGAEDVVTRSRPSRQSSFPFPSRASSHAQYPTLHYRLRAFGLRQRWFQEFRETAVTVGTR